MIGDDYYMKKTPDGKFYWITLTGLNPGQEYTYQYYIDGELKIADPYCHKVLDPWNDKYIPDYNYPNLKQYPFNKTKGIVSVFQTNQTPYNWQITDFTPTAINETARNAPCRMASPAGVSCHHMISNKAAALTGNNPMAIKLSRVSAWPPVGKRNMLERCAKKLVAPRIIPMMTINSASWES